MSYRMDPNIKKMWVDALRSNDYLQNFTYFDVGGGIQLRTKGNRFSVFGVLCNLHAQCHPEIASKELDPESYCGYQYFLPHEVSVWAMLKVTDRYDASVKLSSPVTLFGIKFNSIEELSLKGIPFHMIADVIEEKL